MLATIKAFFNGGMDTTPEPRRFVWIETNQSLLQRRAFRSPVSGKLIAQQPGCSEYWELHDDGQVMSNGYPAGRWKWTERTAAALEADRVPKTSEG